MLTTDEQLELECGFREKRYLWLTGMDYTFMGFVLGLTDSFVLFQRFRDFAPNGYAVVRRDLLTEVVGNSPAVRFFERMLAGEGILEKVGLRFDVPLDSIVAVIRAVQRERLFVLLTCSEHRDPDVDREYDVGEILCCDDELTKLRYLTAAGAWDGESDLATCDIERIEFDTPYLVNLQKYAGPPPR